ncbi:hypothetical protein OS493_010604 [Desmophyllum pertusum]|uniref:Uncharacterized protein n=1 Tax=Desmophyllum pertusum TaxID=174260 RepID=A0A9W9ZR04_9CNID|nr:hypothetical protein OS493_010604 [Desmophyllum pertusum]
MYDNRMLQVFKSNNYNVSEVTNTTKDILEHLVAKTDSDSKLWKIGICGLYILYLVNFAKGLPEVVLASNYKVPLTLDKYRLVRLGWKLWVSKFPCVTVFPEKPFRVVLYLKDLLYSVTQIVAAVYGIWWVHQVAGKPSPTDHDFVKYTVEGCTHLLAKTKSPNSG